MPLSTRSHVDTSGTPDGTTRFRLLRTCRTCEDAFVSQAGTKMMCSPREDPSVLPCNLWQEDSWYGHMLRNHSFHTRTQCAESLCEDPGHPPKK